MSEVKHLWPLLTATHRHDKSISTRNRGQGQVIEAPILADLIENLEEEIAPGLCWQEREDLALASIRKLKNLAREEQAQIWPNHDIQFFRTLRQFPEFHE